MESLVSLAKTEQMVNKLDAHKDDVDAGGAGQAQFGAGDRMGECAGETDGFEIHGGRSCGIAGERVMLSIPNSRRK